MAHPSESPGTAPDADDEVVAAADVDWDVETDVLVAGAGGTGLVAGLLVVGGSKLLERWRVDDVVGAIPVHAFCGAWGTLAVGLFNAEGFMDWGAIGVQAIGLASAIVWTFPTALMAFLLVRAVMGLRAWTMHEQRGLDFTEHAEIAYPEFQQQLSASE
ncbi:MAG: hypothetical protein BRD57_05545 [Proteobacteria bacterium SW_6_67_9]|nr:MAG: hypothetical protein BRD57_05545 [Proteobacteria bacterium SW_6_67_9]